MTGHSTRPWLAGVCARLAESLGGRAWGFRLAWLVLLAVMPLAAIGAYLALALVFDRLPRSAARGVPAHREWLGSPELARHARRISELDRRLDQAA